MTKLASSFPFALSLSKPVLSYAAGGVEGGGLRNGASTSSARTGLGMGATA